MKQIVISIAVVLLFLGPFVLFLKFKNSYSTHVEQMVSLCVIEFRKYGDRNAIIDISNTTDCMLLNDDEFMILVNDKNSSFEMVCYEQIGWDYTLEAQRCSIHKRD